MGKKQKDFQKVKLKVGRKLKRQNETVVDLTRRKIRLPGEKIKTPTAELAQFEQIDAAIFSLKLDNLSKQLDGLRKLNCLLDSHVKRSSQSDQSVVHSRSLSQLAECYKSLFHHRQPDDQSDKISLQLGTLVGTLDQICRVKTDSRLCSPLELLFNSLIKICYLLLPNFATTLLLDLDSTSQTLLRRVEPCWHWLGCRLANSLALTHYKSLRMRALLTIHHHHQSDTVDLLTETGRFRSYLRPVTHLYAQLKETRSSSTRQLGKERLTLVETTLALVKDHQYSCWLACNTGRRHPLINSINLSKDGTESSLPHLSLQGYSIDWLVNASQASVSLAPPPPHTSNLIDASLTGSRTTNSTFFDDTVGLELDLFIGLLDEGLVLLDELCFPLVPSLLTGIYHVVRALRVGVESRGLAFFTASDSPHSTPSACSSQQFKQKRLHLSAAFDRFMTKLYSLVPVNASEDASVSISQSTSSSTTPHPTTHPQHSRRQWAKMKRKLAARQQEQDLEPDVSETPSCSTGELDKYAFIPTALVGYDDRRIVFLSISFCATINWLLDANAPLISTTKTTEASNNTADKLAIKKRLFAWQLTDQFNRACLELLGLVEYEVIEKEQAAVTTTSNPSRMSKFWPPPTDTIDNFKCLLLDQIGSGKYGFDGLLPKDLTPALWLMRWLRSMDFYLNPPHKRSLAVCPIDQSQRLLTPVILTSLGQLAISYQAVVTSSTFVNNTASNRSLLLVFGRLIGLLTHFLVQRYGQTLFHSSLAAPASSPVSTNLANGGDKVISKEDNSNQFVYDDSWLVNSDGEQRSPFAFLLHALFDTAKRELPRIVQTSSPLPIACCDLQEAIDAVLDCYSPTGNHPRLVPIELVDPGPSLICLARLAEIRYKPVMDRLASMPKLRERIARVRRVESSVAPLSELTSQLEGLNIPLSVRTKSLGWVTSSSLSPSPQLGLFASPVYWTG